MKTSDDNKKLLGVCGGIAEWLDIPAAVVRIIYAIGALTWPSLLLLYPICYFLMDRESSRGKLGESFRDSRTAERFRRLKYRRPICKSHRNRRIAGVCGGLADYLDVSAFAVRLLALLSLFIFGPYAVLAYILCALLFDRDPEAPPRQRGRHRRRHGGSAASNAYRNSADTATATPHNAYRNSEERPRGEPAGAGNAGSAADQAAQCADLYRTLELRLRDIEAFVTSKRFRLHCEINRA